MNYYFILYSITFNINQINYYFLEVFRHIPISELLNMKENAKRIDKNIGPRSIWSSVWKTAYVYWMLAVIICNIQVIIILRIISKMYLVLFPFFISGEGIIVFFHKTSLLERELFHLVILASILLIFKCYSREVFVRRDNVFQRYK